MGIQPDQGSAAAARIRGVLLEAEALKILRGLDPNRTTPLEALELLARLVTNLPAGRGRGSSVSSIICYLIGLSHIDPIRIPNRSRSTFCCRWKAMLTLQPPTGNLPLIPAVRL